MASPTPNKGFTYPAHGGSVNAWDSPLNTDFDQIDAILGDAYNITCASTIAGATFNSTYATISSTVSAATINSSLSQKLFFNVTGALTQNLTLTYPAVGSFYVFYNQTTGGFNFNVKTAAGGSTTITISGITMVVTDATSPYNVQPSATFASGTALMFAQAAAPSGWTQDTSVNDRVLRVTSGAGAATGGSWTISGLTVGNTTLTTAQIPAHTHSYNHPSGDTARGTAANDAAADNQPSDTTGSAGSGGSHTHSMASDALWRPSYYDVIRATKN